MCDLAYPTIFDMTDDQAEPTTALAPPPPPPAMPTLVNGRLVVVEKHSGAVVAPVVVTFTLRSPAHASDRDSGTDCVMCGDAAAASAACARCQAGACLSCAKTYAQTQLLELKAPRCSNCLAPMADTQVAHVLASPAPVHVEALDQARDWQARFLAVQARAANADVRVCPHCDALNTQGSAAKPDLTCSACHKSFCFHHELLHAGKRCRGAVKEVRATLSLRSKAWEWMHTKSCPKCTAPIQKNGGCPHMTCSNCTHEFCWFCRADWRLPNGRCHMAQIFPSPRNLGVACNSAKAWAARTAASVGALAAVALAVPVGAAVLSVGLPVFGLSRLVRRAKQAALARTQRLARERTRQQAAIHTQHVRALCARFCARRGQVCQTCNNRDSDDVTVATLCAARGNSEPHLFPTAGERAAGMPNRCTECMHYIGEAPNECAQCYYPSSHPDRCMYCARARPRGTAADDRSDTRSMVSEMAADMAILHAELRALGEEAATSGPTPPHAHPPIRAMVMSS